MKSEINKILNHLKSAENSEAENACKELLKGNIDINDRIVLLDLLFKALLQSNKGDEAEEILSSLVDLLKNEAKAQSDNLSLKQRLGLTLQNLALMQCQMKYYDKALAHARECLEILQEIPTLQDTKIFANALIVYSSVFYEWGDLDEAHCKIKQALVILRKNPDENAFEISTCLNNLGRIYENFEDYNNAYTAYDEAVAIRRMLNPRGMETAFCLGNYGVALLAGAKYILALAYLEEAVEIYIENGLEESKEVVTHRHNIDLCKQALIKETA